MRCKRLERLLYLYREGELSERGRRKLDRHLASCKDCATKKRSIDQVGSITAALRKASPCLPEPECVTAAVLESIESTDAEVKIRGTWKMTDTLLDRLSPPAVRFGIAAFVVLLIGSFLVQESLILLRVSRLEVRMASRSQDHLEERVSSKTARLRKALGDVQDADKIVAVLPILENLRNESTEAAHARANSLIRRYRNVLVASEGLLDAVRNRYPILNGISLRNGLDTSEIERIATSQRELLRIFRRS